MHGTTVVEAKEIMAAEVRVCVREIENSLDGEFKKNSEKAAKRGKRYEV